MPSQDSGTSAPGGSSSRARQALPPIRTLLGEELALGALPPLPSSHSSHSASSRSSARPFWDARDEPRQRSSRSSSGGRSIELHGPHSRNRASTVSSRYLSPHSDPVPIDSLPSAHSLPPSPFSSSPHLSHSPLQGLPDAHAPPWAHPILPNSAPPYSYNVLRPSPSGGLITAPSLARSRPRPRAAAHSATQSDPTPTSSARTSAEDIANSRKHVCVVCQKRFNRPSSLRTHQSVHTGSRPYPCPYSGCGKSFSVASNMRRHIRTTHGGVEPEPDVLGSSDGEAEPEAEEPASVPRGLVAADPGPMHYYEWASAPAHGPSEPFEEPAYTHRRY